MDGEQFNHLSQEIRALRTELTTRLDSVFEKLDAKPNTADMDAVHSRITKHQSETDKDVDSQQAMINDINVRLIDIEKRLTSVETKTAGAIDVEKRLTAIETKFTFFKKVIGYIAGGLAVLSQSSWFIKKFFGGS